MGDDPVNQITGQGVKLSIPVFNIQFREADTVGSPKKQKMKNVFIFLLCLLFSFQGFSQQTILFYVSASGKDTNPGTIEKPFATLEKAKKLVRTVLKQRQPDSVIVYVRRGTYSFKKTLKFDSIDSGSPDHPVVYSAYSNEEVHIKGSVSVPVNRATKITDPKILSRLLPGMSDKIFQINLRALGINDYGELKPKGFARPYEPTAMELFCNGLPMKLSRWPNDSMVTIGKVIDPGSIPRNGDFSNRGAKFTYNTDRPNRWESAKDLWISGFFKYGYADDAVKIAELDTVNKMITTVQPHLYGFESGKIFQSWFAFNLLEEIDQPGEYYIDRQNGILYFFPPAGAVKNIELSLLNTPLITLRNTSHIKIRNIIFEDSRGIGLYIEDGHSNTIQNCVFRNLGLVGILFGKGILPFKNMQHAGTGQAASAIIGSLYNHLYENTVMNRNAGTDHLITGCQVYNTGSGGIILGGGDRMSLKKGNNRVEQCIIHDFNRIDRSYKGGINIDGVGNVIRHNEIYNCPGTAILLHGNDHLIEENIIHDAVTDGDDMGALYYGRDPSESGNKLVHNFFHHIGNNHGIIMAVYHDDGACGMEVTGNIFYKAGSRTVMIGGGNDNIYQNNIFIDCPLAFHIDNRLQNWAANLTQKDGLFQKRLTAVNYRQPPYATAYPFLKDYFSEDLGLPKRNFIENNLFVNVKQLHNGKPQWSYVGRNYFTCDNTIFADYEHMDFSLSSNAEVFKILPGFKQIPFKEIGPHK
jgi:hypothetical protein